MAARVNTIAVAGTHLADIQASLPALRGDRESDGLVVRDWTELEPALNDVILLDMSFSVLLYVSLIVIVVFIILNTLLMSVLERTREFGMLMAVGMRPGQIGRMVWLELLFLAATAAAPSASRWARRSPLVREPRHCFRRRRGTVPAMAHALDAVSRSSTLSARWPGRWRSPSPSPLPASFPICAAPASSRSPR